MARDKPCFYKDGVRRLADGFVVVCHGDGEGERAAFGGAGVPDGGGVTR